MLLIPLSAFLRLGLGSLRLRWVPEVPRGRPASPVEAVLLFSVGVVLFFAGWFSMSRLFISFISISSLVMSSMSFGVWLCVCCVGVCCCCCVVCCVRGVCVVVSNVWFGGVMFVLVCVSCVVGCCCLVSL